MAARIDASTSIGAQASRGRRGLLLGVLGGAATGVVGYVLGGRMGSAMRGAREQGLQLAGVENAALIAACVLSLFLVLLAHELGHLFGGRLVGFRAFLLIIGPFRFERQQHGWRMHLNTNVALAGGMAGSAPTDTHDLPRRSAVMVGAGPFTSLMLGIAALVLWWQLNPVGLDASSSFSRVLVVFVSLTLGGASLAIAVVTMLPMTTSGYLTDGARLLRLWRGGPIGERDAAVQAVYGASLGGQRPRDWDVALLATARQPADGSAFELVAWQLMQMHLADSGRDADAREWLARVIAHADRLPPTSRSGVHYDAARQFALWGDVTAARAQLDLARGPAIGASYLKPLAEAALLFAEGKATTARQQLPALRTALAESIDRGGSQWLASSIDAMDGGAVL